jgi:hypothetical protein
VANQQQALSVDAHRIRQQQIVVLRDRAMDGVFDGQHSALRAAVEKRGEDVGRYRTRQDLVVRREFERSHVAVGAALSLDGDSADR